MFNRQQGFKLFKLFGIQVSLHPYWIVAAIYLVQLGRGTYDSILWSVAELLALFGIVLMHEFGHALACRSVGGRADHILLWPLGGVAYVDPPARPGAMLWSIVAGPLVNALLIPVLYFASRFALQLYEIDRISEDAAKFIFMMKRINIGLLIFNMLPIYPLDGGQILRSLLWFVVGKARSLSIASVIGLVGAVGLVALALFERSIWMGIMAFFAGSQAWRGFQMGKALRVIQNLPRRSHVQCPSCRASAPIGEYWRCTCGRPIDIFAMSGNCLGCGARAQVVNCGDCGRASPLAQWYGYGNMTTAAGIVN